MEPSLQKLSEIKEPLSITSQEEEDRIFQLRLPDTQHSGWLTIFKAGTDITKRNIATTWLFLFDEAFSDCSAEKKLRKVKENIAFLRQIKPYIDVNTIGVGRFFGDIVHLLTINCGIKKEVIKVGESTWRLKYAKDLGVEINTLLYGSDEEQLTTLTKLVIRCEHAAEDGSNYYHAVLPLLFELAWLSAQQYEKKSREEQTYAGKLEKLTLAVRTSMVCGYSDQRIFTEKSLGYAYLPEGWLQIARYAKHEAEGDLSKSTYDCLLDTVRQTPDEIAVPALSYLLNLASYDTPQKEGLLYRYTTLRLGMVEPVSTMYEVLRLWFPQHEENWTMAESLGIDYRIFTKTLAQQLKEKNTHATIYSNAELPALA